MIQLKHKDTVIKMLVSMGAFEHAVWPLDIRPEDVEGFSEDLKFYKVDESLFCYSPYADGYLIHIYSPPKEVISTLNKVEKWLKTNLKRKQVYVIIGSTFKSVIKTLGRYQFRELRDISVRGHEAKLFKRTM